jgi:drug/metabolite transporter (DMT)-like permease
MSLINNSSQLIRQSFKGATFVSFAASLWAFDGIVFRPLLVNLPVYLVVFIESLIVTLIMSYLLFKNYKNLFSLNIKDWLSFLAVSILGGAIGTMAVTKAFFYVNYVNLSIVVFIQKLQPIFAITFATILLKEKLTVSFIIWAIIALIGTYLIAFGINLPSISNGDKNFEATLFALLAAFSFGSSTVFSKRALRNVSVELGTYLRFLITTLVMFVVVTSLSGFKIISEISSFQIVVFILIAFSTGGPAILIYYYGLKRVSASVATICELAFPLVAVILEYFLHDKILSLVQWLGVFILLVSILRVGGFNMNFISKKNC